MEAKEIKQRIDYGRNFLKCEDQKQNDYLSDQELKKPQPPLVKAAMSNQSIALPHNFEVLNLNNDITSIFLNRKSNRVFTQESISLLQLSYLLWATQGIKTIRGKSYATLRTVPCGGARHEFETYFIATNVNGLKQGKYHYLPMTHSIEYIGDIDNLDSTINTSLVQQSWACKASLIFYWSIVCYRCEWRYGIYAHRPALMDIGHVGENLYLACTALNLGVCGVAAFDQNYCDHLFNLDGNEEFIIYTSPVGTISLLDKDKENKFYRLVDEEKL